MLNDIRSISKHLFDKEHPGQIEKADIESMVAEYPYFNAARFLLAREAFIRTPDGDGELITASLYLNNPLRLHWLLNHAEVEAAVEEEKEERETQAVPAAETAPPSDDKQVTQSTDESPIAFQSYHTIDYFASQGIRLQAAELTKDKLGQQLKSFTEWLRSMKKLPTGEPGVAVDQEEPGRHQHVVQSAAHSIEAKEILTEAMAEVWAKQGNRDRAIAIYEKLSLQNTAKSGYFAAKIDQLKAL